MFTTKVASAAALLVVLSGAAACGSSSSSSASAGSDIPTDAAKPTFCTTLKNLKTPRSAVDALTKLGTPSDIDTASRRGFEVLLEQFKALPAHPQPSDLTGLEQKLSKSDQKNVESFGAYVAKECADSLPSSPAS